MSIMGWLITVVGVIFFLWLIWIANKASSSDDGNYDDRPDKKKDFYDRY